MKPEGGWVKLYRKILDNSLWNEKRVFSKAEAWIDIILNANHKDNKILIDGELIAVEKGQWLTSEIKLSNRWNWSRSKVRRFLDVLSMEKMCIKNGTTKYTTLTVVNYGFYQGGDTTVETTDDTTERQQTIQQTIHKQECKKVKNENKKDMSYSPDFESFWKEYPNKKGKSAAFRCWNTRLKEDYSPVDMIQAAKNYAIEKKGSETKFIKHGATFLGPDKPFEDYINTNQIPMFEVDPGRERAKLLEDSL